MHHPLLVLIKSASLAVERFVTITHHVFPFGAELWCCGTRPTGLYLCRRTNPPTAVLSKPNLLGHLCHSDLRVQQLLLHTNRDCQNSYVDQVGANHHICPAIRVSQSPGSKLEHNHMGQLVSQCDHDSCRYDRPLWTSCMVSALGACQPCKLHL